MLTEICNVLRNWFCFDDDKHIGTFEIKDGVLTPPFNLKDNQYYRIIGSVFNDGVHKYGDPKDILTDEEFDGAMWEMRVPKAIIDLSEEISDYEDKYSKNISPYVSESFGGYSYTRATNSTGGVATWQDAFATRLNQWRKIL